MRSLPRFWMTLILVAAVAFFGDAASGQGPGGMPREIPMPREISIPREMPERGIPDRLPDASQRGAIGLDRAAAASEGRLSKAQVERAESMAESFPDDYELDRFGALAIRSEVIAIAPDAKALEAIRRAGMTILRQSSLPELGIDLYVVGHRGMSGSQLQRRLRRIDPRGTYELNHLFFETGSPRPGASTIPSMVPSDANRSSVVGLIDTGVSPSADTGPDVTIIHRSFAPGQAAARPHGTAVASLLVRKPGRVKVYAADIFGQGPRGGTAELLAQAMEWMAQQRVPVVNISIVGPPNRLVAAITDAMIRKGHIVVAPVGNDGPAAKLLYPASYPGVIAVTAADAGGRLLHEASRVKRVDFVAPGIATVQGASGDRRLVRGTSYAAPIIARELADRMDTPGPENARRAIELLTQRTVRPKAKSSYFGRGMIGF